jgi:hypothetical protein
MAWGWDACPWIDCYASAYLNYFVKWLGSIGHTTTRDALGMHSGCTRDATGCHRMPRRIPGHELVYGRVWTVYHLGARGYHWDLQGYHRDIAGTAA